MKLYATVHVNGATHGYQDVDRVEIVLSDGSSLNVMPGGPDDPADELRINARYDTAAAVFLPTHGSGGPIRIRLIAAERTVQTPGGR